MFTSKYFFVLTICAPFLFSGNSFAQTNDNSGPQSCGEFVTEIVGPGYVGEKSEPTGNGGVRCYYKSKGDKDPAVSYGVIWPNADIKIVDENVSMRDEARDYNDSAEGARSNAETRKSQAPAIERTLPDGSKRLVKFDGIEDNVMIDRKLAVVTTKKAKNQAKRQSEALEQNNLTGRWEVPDQTQANRAQKIFNELGITNITVKVTPP